MFKLDYIVGEVQQLQWELSRREAERSALTTEVSSLIAKIEDQKLSLSKAENLQTQFQDIQHKYDALLQMYGEKVEETQELRLDLQDVKEMYKTQVFIIIFFCYVLKYLHISRKYILEIHFFICVSYCKSELILWHIKY